MKLIMKPFIFCLLTLCVSQLAAKSHKEIHRLMTGDEREAIFGHPFPEKVPEYDIAHPVQVDAIGNFLSRDLANGNVRRKRDVDNARFKEPVFFKLSAFGKDFHLNVSLNDELFSSNFEIEIRGNGTSEFHYDIEHCHYIGQLLPVKGNKVAVSNCDGLKGMVRTPEAVFMINPLPKRLGLEKNETRAHLIHRRSVTPVGGLGEALNGEKRSDSWCGVKGDTTTYQTLNDADDNLHMNVPRSSANQQKTIESMIVVEKKMTEFYGEDQIKKYVPTMVNMAHGLLADASIGANIKYIIHKLLILRAKEEGPVITTHAATTLNNFCRWTAGENVDDDANPVHFDHAALLSKYNFCRNKKDAKREGCGDILGLADLKGMCEKYTSCTLNKDTGLGTAFTLAHETAHNLGAEHDGEGNECKDGVNVMAASASGKITAFDWSPCSRKYITSFLQTQQAKCLEDTADHNVQIPEGLPGVLYNGDDQCVRMFGAGSRVCDIEDLKEKMCYNLWCEKPDGFCSTNDEPAADGTSCGKNKWCSRGLCVRVGTKGYKDVDGQWGAWSEWDSCYPTCGGGVRKRVRQCNNPAPKRGGKLCKGEAAEYKYCKQQECPQNFENPRTTQCKSKRNVQFANGETFKWIFDPYYAEDKAEKCILSCATRDGDVSDFGNLRDGTSCKHGICIDGNCKSVGCDSVIGSRAKLDRCGVCNGDGSSCGGGQTPIKQKPKPVKRPNPTKKPATANGGKLQKFTYSQTPKGYEYEYEMIAVLPLGAKNIKIVELTRSPNNLVLETSDYYNLLDYDPYYENYGPEKFRGAGTTFTLEKRNNRETILARGPLRQNVNLMYEVIDMYDTYKVKYQYTSPQSTRSLDSDFPELIDELFELNKVLNDAENDDEQEMVNEEKFKWMNSTNECSASCGGGNKMTTFICVRDDDGSPVGDQYCKEERPWDEMKECNTQRCPASWMIGAWTECSKSCNDGSHGTRTREIFCKSDTNGVELELDDSECKTPKPATMAFCGEQACPAEWDTVDIGTCSTSCGPGVQSLTVKCLRTTRNGTTEAVDEAECTDIKPPTHVACNVENPCTAGPVVEE